MATRKDDEDDRQHDSMPASTSTTPTRRRSRSSGDATDTVSKRWIDRRLTIANVDLDRTRTSLMSLSQAKRVRGSSASLRSAKSCENQDRSREQAHQDGSLGEGQVQVRPKRAQAEHAFALERQEADLARCVRALGHGRRSRTEHARFGVQEERGAIFCPSALSPHP